MVHDTLFVLWFFLGAGLANMAPVFASKWQILKPLDKPADFGKSWRGKRLLGEHKTIRGFVAGILASVLFVLIQVYLYNHTKFWHDFSEYDYALLNPVWFGVVLALGALGGDAIKSFFKRQRGIDPGKSWVPFDQMDYVVGTILLSLLVVQLPLRFYVIALILGLVAHPIANFIAWITGLQSEPL